MRPSLFRTVQSAITGFTSWRKPASEGAPTRHSAALSLDPLRIVQDDDVLSTADFCLCMRARLTKRHGELDRTMLGFRVLRGQLVELERRLDALIETGGTARVIDTASFGVSYERLADRFRTLRAYLGEVGDP